MALSIKTSNKISREISYMVRITAVLIIPTQLCEQLSEASRGINWIDLSLSVARSIPFLK